MIHRAFNRPDPPERRTPLNNRELADDLCAASPALRELRRTHLHAFGALVPHVFMGNVLAHVGRCLSAGLRPGAEVRMAEVASILRALESGMETGDRETRNVIAMSFARDSEVESFFALLRPHLGPRLKVQLGGR